MAHWRDLGGDTYTLSLEPLRLNVGLVIGAERALVIDTGEGPRQARLILDAVREKTQLPLVVVNTHAHYDHFFGNAVFRAAGVNEFWAHENAAAAIAASGDAARVEVAGREPEMAAAEGEDTEIVVPQAIVREQPVLVDLGGQAVTLFYLGRGHTDGDLLVGTPSSLFSGDLVEEGAYPEFGDSYPEEWADVLRHISALRHRYEHLVPGHGALSTDSTVRTMAETMAMAVRSARQATRESPNDATKAIPILPYGPEQSRLFISRLRAPHSLH
ncbi:MBL fold metallo-hydrolase [Sinomonas sp. JGH33]|uniref:MBL fold metallo-hydrolase n=1 Tax=Sinomonas terricola TaxID=3110330 RepID=A0ABU5T1W7_9MICC|nr:MBL fold metallo-hydrolase [Sinomonas sp. JGH33]MEA5453652.1 MBL fold metallo-hydrolase [Sinomonas sp. JGH33]